MVWVLILSLLVLVTMSCGALDNNKASDILGHDGTVVIDKIRHDVSEGEESFVNS